MRLFHREKAPDTAYTKGVQGEKQALSYLRKKGYRLLQKRWRCHGGEIDLIMEDQGVIVFVEVKYRPEGHRGEGIEAVTEEKLRRLRLCADTYLGPAPEKNARIDILEITQDGISHVENIY